MTTVERLGEALARRTSRRQVVVRSAAAMFGVAAAWATQGPFGSSVLAGRCAIGDRSLNTECNPPYNTYCGPGNCDGAMCKSPCELNPFYYPEGSTTRTGCWCTTAQKARKGHGRKKRYYYNCCDCKCPNVNTYEGQCGCRKRVWVT